MGEGLGKGLSKGIRQRLGEARRRSCHGLSERGPDLLAEHGQWVGVRGGRRSDGLCNHRDRELGCAVLIPDPVGGVRVGAG
ncbi:MAG TPA: hypothetical protein VH166_13060, partial [Mycobacterium sp.]|nr:hypothetical protein [Mycobacterium sp.]